jgi:putative transcriptional regulator
MPGNSPLQSLICSAHRLAEANQGGNRISIEDMSKRMKVSHRTLTEYERGTNQPTGMRALLLLLAQLEDEQIVQMVRQFDANFSREMNNEK